MSCHVTAVPHDAAILSVGISGTDFSNWSLWHWQVLLRMKRELRSRMEHEIEELQKIISHNDEDNFIQDLEVQRLRSRMQMASFQFNTSYLQ